MTFQSRPGVLLFLLLTYIPQKEARDRLGSFLTLFANNPAQFNLDRKVDEATPRKEKGDSGEQEGEKAEDKEEEKSEEKEEKSEEEGGDAPVEPADAAAGGPPLEEAKALFGNDSLTWFPAQGSGLCFADLLTLCRLSNCLGVGGYGRLRLRVLGCL